MGPKSNFEGPYQETVVKATSAPLLTLTSLRLLNLAEYRLILADEAVGLVG